jgi:hypothetical protein
VSSSPYSLAFVSACGLAAAMACSTNTEVSSLGPRPDSARAGCTVGIYGGGRYTTIRAGGSITSEVVGPNMPRSSQTEPRDSAAVDSLLDGLARIPWSKLKSADGLHDFRCSVIAWSDTAHLVEWFPSKPPTESPELARVHAGIAALSRRGRATAAPAAATPAPPGGNDSATGTQAQTDSIKPWLETGCGGGDTGGGGGTFVTASGDFYRYQRTGPAPRSPRTLTFVRRDSARAAALVNAAVRDGITTIRFSEPFNMTCHLSLDTRDTSYSVAWPMGQTPAPIRKLVAVAKELDAAAAAK